MLCDVWNGPSTVFLVNFGMVSHCFLSRDSAKGKECNSNAECIGIADTSCVKGYSDSLQSRCLCGDDLAPINGYCSTKLKGLRHQCKRTEDCEDNLICRENNQTKTTILGNFAKGNREKLCKKRIKYSIIKKQFQE